MSHIETRRKSKLGTVLVYVAIAVLLIINLFPVYWMFIGSLKDRTEVYSNPPVFWPKELKWSNFTKALDRGGARGIRNSLIVAGTGALLSVVLGSLAAYSIARYKTGGDFLSLWILSIRMAPPIAGIIPIFIMMRYARLLDKHAALILSYRRLEQVSGVLEGCTPARSACTDRYGPVLLHVLLERVPICSGSHQVEGGHIAGDHLWNGGRA